MKKVVAVSALLAALTLTGCASSVPLASDTENMKAKSFPVPSEGYSGLYVYRDSFVGKNLKKDIYLDGKCVGETTDKVFFYQQIESGKPHVLATESEFSPNNLPLNSTVSGKNYFIRQYIKMGVFVGGAGLELMSEAEGKRVVAKPRVRLASGGTCDN
ncbi:DUF2846 domain-containing protein [Rosenbergiella metrosideri]|uniref:DUF2846 domain-containing protein n=1 Tax=Rosenbergiella metrosideri TaxID=2921185 RepID=UPI001F4F7033|nr:DUF2846 domain-containing protein [Rosenbergiella metrosideri]